MGGVRRVSQQAGESLSELLMAERIVGPIFNLAVKHRRQTRKTAVVRGGHC